MIKRSLLKIFCCFALLCMAIPAKSNSNFDLEVQKAIDDLSIACAQNTEILYDLPLAKLLDYILQNESGQLTEKNDNLGYFSSYTTETDIQTIIRYLSDPFIPHEIFFPQQIRTSYIINNLDLSSESTKLWDLAPEQSAALHLEEYEASTVQPESKAWYGYLQNSIRIKSMYQDKEIFAIIKVQQAKSALGRLGMLIGLESKHNYIYSNKIGSAHKYLSWLKSQIKSKEEIVIFYPVSETQSKIFVFTWLKRTLFGYDISTHDEIKSMQDRQYLGFLQVFKKKLPEPKEIVDYRLKLDKLNDEQIDGLLEPYNEKMLDFAKQLNLEQDNNFKDLFLEHNYIKNLKRPEKISIIMQEFIDEQTAK